MRRFDRWKRDARDGMWWLIGLCMMVAAAALTGCSPKVTEVVRDVKADTVYVGREVRDSIWVRDSVVVREYARGETVYVDRDRWRERVVERLRRDTVYESRVDTLSVIREVYRERTLTDRYGRYVKSCVAILALLLLSWWAVAIWRKTNK